MFACAYEFQYSRPYDCTCVKINANFKGWCLTNFVIET